MLSAEPWERRPRDARSIRAKSQKLKKNQPGYKNQTRTSRRTDAGTALGFNIPASEFEPHLTAQVLYLNQLSGFDAVCIHHRGMGRIDRIERLVSNLCCGLTLAAFNRLVFARGRRRAKCGLKPMPFRLGFTLLRKDAL